MSEPKKQVWACGGGTQSCAIAVLIIQGKLPKPDISVIADTGRECAETWRYLDSVLTPELAKVGIAIERISAERFSYCGTNLFNARGSSLMPMYSTEGGRKSKLPGYCSKYWKGDVCQRYLSEVHSLTESEIVKWLGYGKEEQTRWTRCMSGKDYTEGRIFLPLVTAVSLNRAECQALVKSMGWPVPAPRSRCWMCPNQRDEEWAALSAEELNRAVEVEREIQLKDPDVWLHRSCIPLDQVDFSQPEDLFSRPCDSGMCFV